MSTPSTPSTPSSESAAPESVAPENVAPSSGGDSSAGQQDPESQPAPVGQPAPAAPPSRYSLGTFPNMIRSMVVIGLFVLALVAIVPRITSVERPAVDAAGKAAQVAAQTSLTVLVPQGLGKGWVPTVATYMPGSDQVPTFTTVWTTPSGADIALKQAAGATPGWVNRSVNDGVAAGTVTVSGRSFEKFVASSVNQIAYVAKGSGPKGVTVVASGTAPEDELKAFVAALAPVKPAAGVTPVPSKTTG
ncbi:DUF4245 domain-containing protein [Terrabacter sp. NPDC080008]|uniref:DUF4245 domain-containing protein n=1 Tax=Terrabacter sp. NPDC080008 TaxID=3155176 RepID=UPI00344B38E3